ncbi:hypothetical protein DMN91_000447 [Ooceraea biroi]|uniref:Uncharacterized protein n=1 Tax=Ooceraea biroi TaxID=2015173 RepID=A0A3L8E1P6_OOCBI|nr:hypothetical protein DMN91_000447 [Ooceraea biroi]
MYEELKNVYDWSDGELKSGPRLRGDQRLRYESDNKIDTNFPQLQPLSDRSSSQNDDAQRSYHSSASWETASSISTPASDYFALKVLNDMFKGGLEQNNSAGDNLSNAVSSTIVQSGISKIAEEKRNPSLEALNAPQRSAVNTDSGSPYENREYVESKTREVLKRNINSRNQAAISSQDLHESFVEPLDWHDDFDDNVKVRFGRGLKSVNDFVIPDVNKTYDHVYESDMANAASVNSYLHDFPQTFRENSSISQDCYANATTNLDFFNIRRDTANNDEDLEAAEQKYINRRTPRVRRAATSYRTFYDDMSQNQHDSDEADKSLSSRSQLPNILEDQESDGIYSERAPNWSNDMRDLNRYLRIPQNSRKKEKLRKKGKKTKHTTEKHLKTGSRSSSDRDRRHHAHRSDVSRIASASEWKSRKKNKAHASALAGRGSIQKSKTAERGLLHAAVVNEAPGERVLYENAEDQSTVKPEEDDARRKEITLLLAADNVDDESQMDMALHGELAGKIVDQIFERVQRNDQLRSVFSPGLQRNYKTEDVVAAANIYQKGFNEDGTNHTETMMKRIMELLGRLILNEVQRKTCVSLSPDMREFLGWMLEVDLEEESLGEAPPLPLVHEVTPKQDSGRKFLFENPGQEEKENISNLQKEVQVLETLVEEYNALTAKEKTEVQTIYDYLLQQLNQLLQHIEAREAEKRKLASISTGAARVGTGTILQYQNAMPNTTNATYSMKKNASSSPIDTHSFFRSNNTSLKMMDRQLYNNHAASSLFHHRETRNLDKVLKQRHKKKRQKIHNRKKNKNHRKSMQKRRKHQDHTGSLPMHRNSRRKRADLEENDWDSFYLGYEAPTIYDSFELLDAKLTGKEKKRKRELADKGSVAAENDGTLDSLPIKGKNRLEDEVILLNKREAWKRENEEQLEEIAFGKDMRNSTRERERFEKLTGGDKRRPIDEIGSRTKREDVIRETSAIRSVDRSSNSSAASKIGNGESKKNSTSKEDNVASSEDRLRLVERRINVFMDNNKTDAAIDTTAAEVSTGGKLAINGATDNQVKGKLRAINCETKIDKANGNASFVNLTSDTRPRVSKEQREVQKTERETDDNAVKLNRATNHRSEEIDPEVELKNLRQQRERGIYGVADWRATDLFYDDDNLPRNKLRGKYVANLDEPDDLDTGPKNNLALLRLRSKKRPNDVVEWKLVPVIRRSPYRDVGASSRIGLTERRVPVLSNDRNVRIDLYLDSPKFWRLKHRRMRNGAPNISPMLRIIDDEDSFSLGIPPKTKRAIEIAGFKDLQVNPKMLVKQKLSRLRNNKRSDGSRVVGFRMSSAWNDLNRKLRNLPRSRDDLELGDQVIYDDGVGLQLPIWPYQYYINFAHSPTTFHLVPDILGRISDTYRYPARAYLEYGPFKGRTRNSDQRVARRDGFRLGSWKEATDFPADNLTNKSLKSGLVHEKVPVKTDESARANREDYPAPVEMRYTPGKIRENNETRARLEK